jgi:nucleotide-binding universal stress UspA family protein
MFKRILIATDGSPTATKALVTALQLARESGGQVRLVHALDELPYLSAYEFTGNVLGQMREEGGKLLDNAVAMAQAAGIPAEHQLLENPGVRLGEVVASEARQWKADLIVVGTHGRRGIGRVLLGSGAEQVVRSAPVPVLVIRGDEG